VCNKICSLEQLYNFWPFPVRPFRELLRSAFHNGSHQIFQTKIKSKAEIELLSSLVWSCYKVSTILNLIVVLNKVKYFLIIHCIYVRKEIEHKSKGSGV